MTELATRANRWTKGLRSWALSARPRFCLLFALSLSIFASLFHLWEIPLAHLYLQPVSAVTSTTLNAVGITAQLDTSSVPLGFCLIAMERITFRVIHECTGIFSLFIFLAAVLAYPAPMRAKGWAVALGLVAFFLYGCLRLVLLGVVGQLAPTWVPVLHQWMVLINLGYALSVWLFWVTRLERHG